MKAASGSFATSSLLRFFYFNDQFYQPTDGVVMGSSLSPVIANFFMKHFEQVTLGRVA
jgi:hypothetical protein